jgi:hypothetical protein
MSRNTEFIEKQQEGQREQQKLDAGFAQASAAGLDQGQIHKDRRFFDSYRDPDISPGPAATQFEKRVKPELSHHQMFGNIDRAEFERRQPLNQALAMQVKAEFPRRSGPSSKCTGSYREALVGERQPTLTDEMARKIDSTLGEDGVRSQMQSQSIQASAWKGITTMKSVVKTMGENAKSASSGVLGRAKQFLFGGNE